MATIIGLYGSIGTGKSAICNAESAHSKIVVPMAKKIKSIALELGWNGEKDIKGRRLLEMLGHDLGRELINPDIWVHQWHKYVYDNNLHNMYKYILIDDVRYENEVDYIHRNNGYVVKVTRNNHIAPVHPTNTKAENNLCDVIPDLTIETETVQIDIQDYLSSTLNTIIEFTKRSTR